MPSLLYAPFTFLVFQLLCLEGAFFLFDYIDYLEGDYSVILLRSSLLVFFFFLFSIYVFTQYKGWRIRDYELTCKKLMITTIVSAMLLEYLTLGIPLLGHTSYHTFGYPYIHHISVSSWLFIFCINGENTKLLNTTFLVSALLNPLLMVNRDAFLLTIFAIVSALIIKKMIRSYHLIFAAIFVVFVFGYVGQIRSPQALEQINNAMPLRFDLLDMHPSIAWFSIYSFSSMFNLLTNFQNEVTQLYYQHINTFPEVTNWIREYGGIGAAVFYSLVGGLVLLVYLIALKNKYLVPFYIYLCYQSIMTLFSKKFFKTNTLFVLLFLLLLICIEKYICLSKSQKLKKGVA